MDEYERFRQWFCELKDRRNNRHMDEPDFDKAVWKHITRQILIGRINEVKKALTAGSIRTVPTDKGNNVEWWPDGLNRTLNDHLAQLQSELAKLERKSE